MDTSIFDGLSLVDVPGRAILATTAACLLGAVATHAFLRARYAAIQGDLVRNHDPRPQFAQRVLRRIHGEAEAATLRSAEPNTQAIIEDVWQSELAPLLLAERFVRAAPALVLVLGLLGTFYGLTLSIGRLVSLVAADPGTAADIGQAVTHGLAQALTGMAVAFSNSLVGIASAVVLTVLGVVNNVTDRRTALMVQIEAYLDRVLVKRASARGEGASVGALAETVARLDGAVARFEAALRALATSTKDLREVKLVVALPSADGHKSS